MRSFRHLTSVFLLAAALLAIAGLLVPVPGFAFELNTDRPDADYTSSELPNADPRLCVARCEIENQCLAWSYTAPGVQGPAARCSLENSAPSQTPSVVAVSGLCAGTPPPPARLNLPPHSATMQEGGKDSRAVTPMQWTLILTQTGNRVSGSFTALGKATMPITMAFGAAPLA